MQITNDARQIASDVRQIENFRRRSRMLPGRSRMLRLTRFGGHLTGPILRAEVVHDESTKQGQCGWAT